MTVSEMEAIANAFVGGVWFLPFNVRPIPSGYENAFYDWTAIVEQFWAQSEGLA